jgi:hypothetical protein
MSERDDGVTFPPADIRRRQILTLLAVIAAGGLPSLPGVPAAGKSGVELVPETLTDPGAAERFGRAYLAAFPSEADRDTLLQRLAAALVAGEQAVPSGAGAVLARFDRLVRGEYTRGDVIGVDGWLLSRSEARLYALSVFCQPA